MTGHDSPAPGGARGVRDVRVHGLPAGRAWALVALGVLGVSLSAPIATATAAPALAVAFWRTALGTAVTAPVAVGQRLRVRADRYDPPGLSVPISPHSGAVGLLPVPLPVLAGVLLAVHFGTWIPSLRLTSVTASTALVTTSPVWIVVADRLRGVRVPQAVVLGVMLACGGVLAVTGVDAGRSARALTGDLLALAGALAGAGYMVVGERARRTASTAMYTTVAYGSCAVTLLPACLLLGVPLGGWHGRAWVEIVVLTAAAQLLGHTAFNAALPTVGPTALALAILLEVPGAALVAWIWLGQRPPAGAVVAAAAVLVGLAVVVRARGASHAGAS